MYLSKSCRSRISTKSDAKIHFVGWIKESYRHNHLCPNYSTAYTYTHTELVITTLQSELRPSCSPHSCCVLLRKCFKAGAFTLRVFARNLPRGNCRWNIFLFHISLWCLAWDTSNEPTHYLLNYGDFNITTTCNNRQL